MVTLKDIEKEKLWLNEDGADVIRKEAINWIKELNQCIISPNESSCYCFWEKKVDDNLTKLIPSLSDKNIGIGGIIAIKEWIKLFFDIKGDLK